MATFSSNQVRHLFVANAYSATPVTAASAVGTLSVGGNATGGAYIAYKSPGGVLRSDIIYPDNIVYSSVKKGSELARNLRKDLIALDPNNVSAGLPVAGQDYLLRITFKQHIGLSVEDQYVKYGVVRATANMTAREFYEAMVDSLNMNFSREITPLLSFSLAKTKASTTLSDNAGVTVTAVNGGEEGNDITFAISAVDAAQTAVTVTGTAISVALAAASATIGGLKAAIAASNDAKALVTITGTDATAVVAEDPAVALAGGETVGFYVEELEQPWLLGKKESGPLFYTLQPDLINVVGDEFVWGTVTAQSPDNSVGNGKMIADLEYFAMGERGDIYRGMGFPNNIETTYLANPANTYSLLDIHFFYQGQNEAVQKSEKTLTIAVVDGAPGSVYTTFNSILNALETALGITINADLTE